EVFACADGCRGPCRNCHLWDLDGNHIHRWRLSSGNVQEIAVSVNYVTLLSPEEFSGKLHIHVLEIKTRRASSSAIPLNSFTPNPDNQAVFVDDDRGHIIIMRGSASLGCRNIHLVRFSCSAMEIVSERNIELGECGIGQELYLAQLKDWQFTAYPGTYASNI